MSNPDVKELASFFGALDELPGKYSGHVAALSIRAPLVLEGIGVWKAHFNAMPTDGDVVTKLKTHLDGTAQSLGPALATVSKALIALFKEAEFGFVQNPNKMVSAMIEFGIGFNNGTTTHELTSSGDGVGSADSRVRTHYEYWYVLHRMMGVVVLPNDRALWDAYQISIVCACAAHLKRLKLLPTPGVGYKLTDESRRHIRIEVLGEWGEKSLSDEVEFHALFNP